MIIHAISDTHMSHEDVHLPGGDILLVAGDFSGLSRVPEIAVFNEWLKKQPYKHRVVVPGNHDLIAEASPGVVHKLLSAAHLLIHEPCEIAGIKIFGSPWTPEFYHWGFMYPRCSVRARELWAQIPDDTELLLTHGPAAHTKLGVTPVEDAGCEVLHNRIEELPQLKAHVCGHIHCGYGRGYIGAVQCYNVSVMDDWYNVVHPYTLIDWR